jgi:hypothetical protein
MLANNLPLGGDDNALGIHPNADRAIGEGRRHAVAIALLFLGGPAVMDRVKALRGPGESYSDAS